MAEGYIAREDNLVGACLITMTEDASWCPDEMIAQPHLTWIFVAPLVTRQGIGRRLLQASANQLASVGLHTLYSTFLVGNESTVRYSGRRW